MSYWARFRWDPFRYITVLTSNVYYINVTKTETWKILVDSWSTSTTDTVHSTRLHYFIRIWLLIYFPQARNDVVKTVKLFIGIECQCALGTADGKIHLIIISSGSAPNTRQVSALAYAPCCVTVGAGEFEIWRFSSGTDKGHCPLIAKDWIWILVHNTLNSYPARRTSSQLWH